METRRKRRLLFVVSGVILLLIAAGILFLVLLKGDLSYEIVGTSGTGPADSSTPRTSPFLQPASDGTAGEKGASATPSNTERGGPSATVQDQPKTDEGTGGALKGRVINVKEEPVAGARVVLTGEFDLKSLKMEKYQILPIIFRKAAFPDKTLAKTCTDEMGEFAFFAGEVDDGVYCLLASSAGFATGIKHEVKVKTGVEGKPIVVVLGPAALLSGRVVNPSKVPVEGAIVTAFEEERGFIFIQARNLNKFCTLTGEKGEFRFMDLPPGRCTLVARKKGFAMAWMTNVSVPSEEEIEIELVRGFRVEGRILDKDTGKPIAGARIWASTGGGGSDCTRVESAGDGRYEIEGLASGEWHITVRARGYMRGRERIEGTGGAVVGKDIRLDKGIVVSGKVLDAMKKTPLSGVRVVASGAADFTMGIEEDDVVVESGRNGEFALTVETAQSTWKGKMIDENIIYIIRLIAKKEGWLQQASENLDLSPEIKSRLGWPAEAIKLEVPFGENRVEGVVILMQKAPKASGHVVNKAGDPVARATILVVSPDTRKHWECRSDEQGKFDVNLLLGRNVCLFVQTIYFAFGFHAFGEVLPGDDFGDLEMRLSAGGSIKGRVLDEKGEPVSVEEIECRYLGGGRGEPEGIWRVLRSTTSFDWSRVCIWNRFTRPEGTGKFVFRHLRPGVWEVSVKSRSHPSEGVKVVVAEGRTEQVPIRLPAPLSIEGVVVDESGVPLEGIDVSARPMKGEGGDWVQSGKDGAFRIGNLLQGKYKITAWNRGRFLECVFDNVQAGAVGVRIVMKKRERDE